MADKPALEPKTAIGAALRAVAGHILAGARAAITDPQLAGPDAVHEFRRAMKQWRALMRLLRPFVVDAERLRIEARDHARSLASARDGQAALNALDQIVDHTAALSARSTASVRERLEALRGSEERAVLTEEVRDAIAAWLDGTAAAVELWPLDAVDFAAVAARLAAGYRRARDLMPADWTLASPEDLHALRQRVVEHRYQMELVEPLWPRFGRMWTAEAERLRDRLGKYQDLAVLERLAGPHQKLARWRSRLVPASAERRAVLAQRAERIARRLFAERPKAFRERLEALWEEAR
jgi:CHAD domain-containing protein